jgi:hypothetical protein
MVSLRGVVLWAFQTIPILKDAGLSLRNANYKTTHLNLKGKLIVSEKICHKKCMPTCAHISAHNDTPSKRKQKCHEQKIIAQGVAGAEGVLVDPGGKEESDYA